jgi:hypothetical protein
MRLSAAPEREDPALLHVGAGVARRYGRRFMKATMAMEIMAITTMIIMIAGGKWVWLWTASSMM